MGLLVFCLIAVRDFAFFNFIVIVGFVCVGLLVNWCLLLCEHFHSHCSLCPFVPAATLLVRGVGQPQVECFLALAALLLEEAHEVFS